MISLYPQARQVSPSLFSTFCGREQPPWVVCPRMRAVGMLL